MKKKIVNCVLGFLEQKTSFKSDQDRQKAEYILSVIVDEIGKTSIMLIMFGLIGKGFQYIIALITVLLTRTFAGGLHEKSSIGCLIHSFLFFSMSIVGTYFVDLISYPEWIYFATMLIYLLWAPQVSDKRGRYSRKRKYRLKIYSLIGISLVWGIGCLFPELRAIIISTVLLELLEFSILIITKGGKKICGS